MLFMIFLLLIGISFYAKEMNVVEAFSNAKPRCPDMLIQKGSRFYLYNSKLAQVPGVNPIEFENLEDYTTFLEWQRSQGVRCPVLYLQSSYDAQGKSVYNVRPSVTEPQAGINHAAPNHAAPPQIPDPKTVVYPNPTLLVDATKNDPPYNKSSYPSYDPSSYYIGTTTPLDMMNVAQEQAPISPDPMDPNWGGPEYTQKLVDSGYYKNYEVNIYVP